MKIELHLLQNFAPSNLNRDDTGAPKDCEFGGHRRARISSQCQKRAVREAFTLDRLVDPENRGARTKRLIENVVATLKDKHDQDAETAVDLAIGAIEGLGLGRSKKGAGEDLWKTEYLLFVPRRIIDEIARILHAHRDTLTQGFASADGSGKTGKKKGKKAAKSAYPKDVRQQVEALLKTAGRAVDIALFGRMIADKPEWNVDAACQVAQAISTNRVHMDFDFFTAIDDLKPEDTAGSDMMGTIQFNSSCFYRYAVLDIESLQANLDNDDTLVRRAVSAFVQGFVTAIPTGKQNGMAAHNFPSYALAALRESGQPLSLTNAFLKPARPRGEDIDLVDDSIEKLESYAVRLREALGPADWVSWADRDLKANDGLPARVTALSDFYAQVTDRAFGGAAS